MSRTSWSEEKVNRFKELYPINSNKELCNLFGFTNKRSISNLAIKYNLKKEIDFSIKGNLKPLLEDNNISYYWLGFIMADGYISDKGQLVVALSNKDEEHLLKLSKLLNTTIKNYPQSNKIGIQSKIAIQDKKYGILLREKLGIIGQKTYTAPPLNFIPYEYILPFIIGFIDGDGCISNRAIRIQCHKSWESNFKYIGQYFMTNYNMIHKLSLSKDKYISISFTISNSKIIKDNMVKLNVPYLERKWDKID